MRILVLEDEEAVAEVIQRNLELLGLTCLLAQDVPAADRLLTNEPVDAVTLDLGMPGCSGLSWLERIATTHPELARKTLVITGLDLDAEAVERLAACGAGVLAKPFTMTTLQDAVRTQISRPDHRPPSGN